MMTTLSRRGWIAASLAAPVLLRARNRIDRSRISAISDEIATTPAEAIAFAKQYGLRWLELRSVPGRGGRPGPREYFLRPAEELREAAKELSDNGIGVSFLNTSMCKYWLPGTAPANPRHSQNPERFKRRLEELDRAIEAARIFGTNKIRVFTFWRVENPRELLPRIAETLDELAAVARKAGMQLLIENENACNVASCGELADLLKMLPSEAIGINWDPFNAENTKEIAFPDGYNMLPVKRIGNVQIKGKSILPGPQRMDWAAIFRRLETDGYQGQVGLETHIFGPDLIQHSHSSMQEILRIVELT
jgi:sugar phosphate isomerase/epimerase